MVPITVFDPKLYIREVGVGKSTWESSRDLILPANSDFDFENQLVALEYGDGPQLKFVMSDGERSEVPWHGEESQLFEIDRPVSKIVVCYLSYSTTYGIKFLTKDGDRIL